ncbi:MAG: prepilin peptidase [Sphingomicrobium sp.]
MNLITTAPLWLILLLALFLLAAAVEDVVRLRIANLTCLGIGMLAVVAMALHGFGLPLWQNGAVFAGLLAIGTIGFATGTVGGGDVKLLAVTGLWFSLSAAVWLLAAVFLAGGALALIMISTRSIRSRVAGKGRRHRGKIPYGVAIVAGAAIVMTAQYRGKESIYDRLHLTPPTSARAATIETSFLVKVSMPR